MKPLFLVSATLCVLLLAACGGGSKPGAGAQNTRAPRPTPTAVLSKDLNAAVENIVIACRQKNAAALSTMIYGQVSRGEIDALFARGRDVVLKSQAPTADGDPASVLVDLDIQRGSGSERVQRTWQLTRASDGYWRVTGIPDCY